MARRNLPHDVIAALATAPGRGGIGVVRMSGSGLGEAARRLSGRTPVPRVATVTHFRDANGETIDTGLLLYFPAPNSYTGEDVLELQGHGGPVVMQRLLRRCLGLGARLAAPGEFTRRAFLNGKMDLAQAEAVADLIDASTEAAARSAIRSLEGDFSAQVRRIGQELVELRSLVEATLDFPEEELDVLRSHRVMQRVANLAEGISTLWRRGRQGSLLRTGLQVVLAGAPNAGKSSLLNRLARTDRAIVTEIPGTTRDAVRESVEVHGIPLHIIDTAGLRKTSDPIETLGIDRSWREIERADLILLVVDACLGIGAPERDIVAQFPPRVEKITVLNKVDLCGREPACGDGEFGIAVSLSAKTGAGIDLLERELLRAAGWNTATEDVVLARERHLVALQCAAGHIEVAREESARLELLAEELRLAHEALEEITGEFSSDDLLGEIFSRFCIGK